MADDRTGFAKGEVIQATNYFRQYVQIAHRTDNRLRLAGRSYQMAQWALQSEASDAVGNMAARIASGSGPLADLVRKHQDLRAQRGAADKRLIAAIQRPQGAGEVDRRAMRELDARLDDLDVRLAKDFPEFAALASPEPLDIGATQALLRPDEPLLQILSVPAIGKLPEETFAWVVTKTAARWLKLSAPPSAIAREVAGLRCGLDESLWSGDGCRDHLKATPAGEVFSGQTIRVLPFDLSRAHALYAALLGPFEDMIKGKHLLVVPSGPLTSLPFSVLVTETPKMTIPGKLADYRRVAWLGTRQPITVLPSVASLRALRQYAKASRATKPLIAFGNPLLDGPDSRYEGRAKLAREKGQCPKTAWRRLAQGLVAGPKALNRRGGLADVAEIRKLEPLPETADELCAVARDLGIPESNIRLGERATEQEVKTFSESGELSAYRIVHFATHGAVAGELKVGTEPGLILTPPAIATPEDDGYLSASEIASLKLDADWVILSACNTAAGGAEGAEALSGMARAFFYAGARALLVSHWAVNSDSTVKLVKTAVGAMAANKTVGRAEALRRSMTALIARGAAHEAHPAYWAPFVVVGEGAIAR